MSFQVIATLLVVILVTLYIYSHFYQKKAKELSRLEAQYIEALKAGQKEKALEVGLVFLTKKGMSADEAKLLIEKDLSHA